MGKKNDLSNLLSKKVNHNNKRPSQYHQNLNNRNNLSENSSNESNDSSPSALQKKAAEVAMRAYGVPKDLTKGIANDEKVHELAKKNNITLKFPLKTKIVLTALIMGLPIILLMLFVVLFSNQGSSKGSALAFGGYYESRCDEMTVIFVDPHNSYAVTGSQTYSMEDYVAGVVSAEVGGFANKEVFKVYAIAARTFALKHASEDCSIEGSARRQAFKDITNSSGSTVDMIYEAVRETEGEVILSNGELYSTMYDAFCYTDKDSQYYTLAQQNQKIPVEWAESHVWSKYYLNCPCNLNDNSMTECWKNGRWQDGGHGSGMSQYGAYYLATEQDYTYDQILEYYYGDDGITITTNSFISSIAGLEIKNTTNATYLKEPITGYLNSKGSSLENMNQFIYENVKEVGAGTREGVVTAAVSMINYLYDNFNAKLPYYWGGSSQTIGLPSSIGTYSASAVSRNGNVNYYKSFDCSGFVSWAIRNGGYNFTRHTSMGFHSDFSGDSCNIRDSSCKGQVGDLINSNNCHVQLIVAVDEEAGKYFIAESSGNGVAMTEWGMHSSNCGNKETRILHMDNFYNNSNNVDLNY